MRRKSKGVDNVNEHGIVLMVVQGELENFLKSYLGYLQHLRPITTGKAERQRLSFIFRSNSCRLEARRVLLPFEIFEDDQGIINRCISTCYLLGKHCNPNLTMYIR